MRFVSCVSSLSWSRRSIASSSSSRCPISTSTSAPGNALVGFASLEHVRRSIEGAEQTRLDVHGALDRITEAAAETQASADRHRALHLAGDRDDVAIRAAKGELRTRLDALGSELDRYLAQEYGIDVDDGDVYEEWLSTHEPFHWAVEFYGVMAASMS